MTFNPQSNTKFHTVYSLRAKLWHIYDHLWQPGYVFNFPPCLWHWVYLAGAATVGRSSLTCEGRWAAGFSGADADFFWVLPGRSAKVWRHQRVRETDCPSLNSSGPLFLFGEVRWHIFLWENDDKNQPHSMITIIIISLMCIVVVQCCACILIPTFLKMEFEGGSRTEISF